MVEQSGLPPLSSLKELIEAAQKEDWEAVDASISIIAQLPSAVVWAEKQGLSDEDVNMRDLGVSILEVTKRKLDDNTLVRLTEIMYSDSARHVQYRAAFALFNHNGRTSSVVTKIEQARQDPELAEIAEKYLAELNN